VRAEEDHTATVLVDDVVEVRGEDVIWIHGRLERLTPPLTLGGSPLYRIGGATTFPLPPLPGTIRERDNGLDFELTDGLTLRVAWYGSRERQSEHESD
jgi:hypothetical protein